MLTKDFLPKDFCDSTRLSLLSSLILESKILKISLDKDALLDIYGDDSVALSYDIELSLIALPIALFPFIEFIPPTTV